MPVRKVGGSSEVDDAALLLQSDVAEKALVQRLWRFIEMGKENHGASFPAFIVSVKVNPG